jgi:NADH:ubiquinone oxidoreductase subunit 5 (subunit L)/multisubunit Na+/H+ antiporter MnhA subunit
LTLAAAAIAVVAMSGLPPLAGFGAKWLLLSAMMEKNWYAPAAMTLLATFVGFLYMARFIQAVFLGTRNAAPATVAEAPLALLVPQYLMVVAILVISFFPKLLIEPISQAIDPQFASTLVWQGMSLEMIYGYWNPVPVMAFAVAVVALLFGLFWLVQRFRRVNVGAASEGIYGFAGAMCAALTPPLATRFWDELTAATSAAAQQSRRLYTGNAQSYNLYILYYLLVLYAAGGGISLVDMAQR